MEPAHARYDGNSEWYDETFGAFFYDEETAFLRKWLGAGSGETCLDVACGTGLHGRTVAEAGYRAVGFDISADQLGFARRRLEIVVRADARHVPLRDQAVAVALGMFFHTDIAPRDLELRFTPGYGNVGWAGRGSGDGSGIGGRVGFHHKTLTGLLGAIADAGLSIREVREISGGGWCCRGTLGSLR